MISDTELAVLELVQSDTVGTFIILKLLSFAMDLRVKPVAEEQGLDINEHGEEGYGEEFAAGLGLAGASGELR